MLTSTWITGILRTIAAWRKTQVANEAAEGTQSCKRVRHYEENEIRWHMFPLMLAQQ
jgi:hypothetical protein